MLTNQTIIMSLGGSMIVPDEINVSFLREFRELILNFVKRGNRAIIVAGGGGTNKKYNKAAQELAHVSNDDLDWLGIATTKLNAELLRVMFGQAAYEKVIDNPTKKIKTNKKIIIGSGWVPGCSSDKDAILLAKNFGAKIVVNLTNIDYIYDKDPRQFPDAKPFKELSWREYRKIVGNKWVPRMHAPFDPIASQFAAKWGMRVVVMKAELENIKNFLAQKEFKGTVLK